MTAVRGMCLRANVCVQILRHIHLSCFQSDEVILLQDSPEAINPILRLMQPFLPLLSPTPPILKQQESASLKTFLSSLFAFSAAACMFLFFPSFS